MLSRGDLIRIPANTCIIQERNELAIIDNYKYTTKPKIGIFIKYERDQEVTIFFENEFWIVKDKDIRYVGAAC